MAPTATEGTEDKNLFSEVKDTTIVPLMERKKMLTSGCQIALFKIYVLAWQPHICYHYILQPEKPTFHQVNKILIASLVK